MAHVERLQALREQMKVRGIDAYIIPSSDPHISEYLPERYKCIAWVSGFTGSAGTLAITQDFAGLWTDSRYFVQAAEQLAGSGFELVKLKVQGAAEYAFWLTERLAPGSRVAFDGNLASVAVAKAVEEALRPAGIAVDGHLDLLDVIWKERPALPTAKAYLLDEMTTGMSTENKLERVREKLKAKRAQAHLISSLDDLAWVLNMRGSDVKCNPVVLGFLLLEEEQATLFMDGRKLSDAERGRLAEAGVTIKPYEDTFIAVANIQADSILLDPKRTWFALDDAVRKRTRIVEDINPSTRLKALKNEVEIAHTRNAMVKDGVAMTRFFKWIEEHVSQGNLTEMSIAERLQQLRAEGEGFVDISFDTIAGYRAHGALPHYK